MLDAPQENYYSCSLHYWVDLIVLAIDIIIY